MPKKGFFIVLIGRNSMRLFIAINFNENMKYALLKMQNELKKSGVKGSFTREENLHMTMVFIGENDDPGKIEKIMWNVSFKAFPIRISGFRRFKDMIFANVEDNPDLKDYVKRLRLALSENNIDYDRKSFMPHITLVRRVSGTSMLEKQTEKSIVETMKVNRISLMKSEQGKYGMIYTEIGYAKAF